MKGRSSTRVFSGPRATAIELRFLTEFNLPMLFYLGGRYLRLMSSLFSSSIRIAMGYTEAFASVLILILNYLFPDCTMHCIAKSEANIQCRTGSSLIY